MDKGLNDFIFDFILELAFRDATMRSAFQNPYKQESGEASKQQKDDFEDLKVEIRQLVSEPVKQYLNSIIKNELKECSVYNCINDIVCRVSEFNSKVQKSDGNHSFTFGNAQKLVNMAAKYLYIVCYADPKMRENFKFCHCPMDSIMIDEVINDAPDKKMLKFNRNTSWSTLKKENADDIEAYRSFQEAVKVCCKGSGEIPLEYEFRKWSENKNKKSKESI